MGGGAGMGLADSRFSASSMYQECIFLNNPHYSFKDGFIPIFYIRKLRFSKIIYLAQTIEIVSGRSSLFRSNQKDVLLMSLTHQQMLKV